MFTFHSGRRVAALLGLLFPFLSLAAGEAQAQTRPQSLTIKIKVLSDTDGEPVTGASCLLTDYGIFGMADVDGYATLQKVPAGKATLSIQMLGYEDYNQVFHFQRDSSFTVRIQESSLTLEEVVVTAKPSAAGSSTSSSIGRMAIDHLQATSLKDIMQLLPGQLMSSSDMTSEEKLTIRTLNQSTANGHPGEPVFVKSGKSCNLAF